MSDTNDRTKRKRDWDEFERLDDRIYARARANSDAKDAARRLQSGERDKRTPLERAQDRLNRLERSQERSIMRHLPDFDARREVALENLEYRTNPEGASRRRSNEGLDRSTEREVRDALRKRGRRTRGNSR